MYRTTKQKAREIRFLITVTGILEGKNHSRAVVGNVFWQWAAMTQIRSEVLGPSCHCHSCHDFSPLPGGISQAKYPAAQLQCDTVQMKSPDNECHRSLPLLCARSNGFVSWIQPTGHRLPTPALKEKWHLMSTAATSSTACTCFHPSPDTLLLETIYISLTNKARQREREMPVGRDFQEAGELLKETALLQSIWENW